MKEHKDKLAIREQAASSIAHMLSDELSPADEKSIGAWGDASPQYQQEFLAAAHLLADMEPLKGADTIQAILNETDGEAKAQAQRKWPRFAMAASLLIATVVGTLMLSDQRLENESGTDIKRYVTGVGEQKEVQLPDGSIIYMNTASEMLVDMGDETRVVTLKRGEAFFDVATDPSRPFSVDIGPRTLTVLGTEFNVYKRSEGFTVAVAEGEVALHNPAEPVDPRASVPSTSGNIETGEHLSVPNSRQYRLTAGWVAQFDAGDTELTAYTDDSLDVLASWRSGIVSFSGEPLSLVVKELNRYSGKKILIIDKSVMDLKVNAGIKVDSITSALASLERVYPIRVKHEFDQVLIEGAGK